MKKPILTTIVCIYFVANLLLQLLAPKFLLENLSRSLPFREAYYPTIAGIALAYIVPTTVGYILGLLFSSGKIKRPNVYYISIALIFGFINAVGVLIRSYGSSTYWFNAEVNAYYVLLYPILLLVGMMPFFLRSGKGKHSPDAATNKSSNIQLPRRDLGLALAIGGVLFLLNLLPMLLSRYLVGADVYYHAAKTQSILNGDSLFSSPFFLHEKNYYYSIVYYILAFVSKVTHASVVTVWFLYIPICSLIFGAAYYLFVLKLKHDRKTALLATIFVALSNQIIWADPSDRGLGYALLALASLTAVIAIRASKLWLYSIFAITWLLAIATHPEIAVHIICITLVFFILLVPRIRVNIAAVSRKITTSREFNGRYIARFDSPKNMLLLLALYLLLGFSATVGILQHFAVTQTLIYNEIPLSLLLPIGIASFAIGLFALTGLKRLLENVDDVESRLIISIMALAGMALFYFLHLWQLYHRYFVETAFMGFAIVAAMEVAVISSSLSKRLNAIFLSLIMAFAIASLIPKLDFMLVYARGTNTSLGAIQPDFNLIKSSTTKGSVILINPTNIMNRYIPVYANRKIFAGSSLITKDQQWQVLSFCNGPFSAACDKRDQLATAFFEHPTVQGLETIQRSYEIDYLLVNQQDPIEYGTFLHSDFSHIRPIASDNDYLLIDVRSMQ